MTLSCIKLLLDPRLHRAINVPFWHETNNVSVLTSITHLIQYCSYFNTFQSELFFFFIILVWVGIFFYQWVNMCLWPYKAVLVLRHFWKQINFSQARKTWHQWQKPERLTSPEKLPSLEIIHIPPLFTIVLLSKLSMELYCATTTPTPNKPSFSLYSLDDCLIDKKNSLTYSPPNQPLTCLYALFIGVLKSHIGLARIVHCLERGRYQSLPSLAPSP